MITVSSITKNTGRYAMIHTAFFYIPVNFAFNLPHYVANYMNLHLRLHLSRSQ